VCKLVVRFLGIASLITVMSSPASAQDLIDHGVSPARKTQRVLEAAGLTLGVSHTFEVIGGNRDAVGTPLAGGLTDAYLRWTPTWQGCSKCGEFRAGYSAYSQTRPSTATDMQGLSSLTAPTFHRWRQAYYQVSPVEGVRIKAGKVDANTEFAVVEAAGDLSNASAGLSPTLFTMPSYPDGALSLNAFVIPAAGFSVGAGAYRTVEGGRYYVTEAGRRWQGSRPRRIAGGFWQQRNGPIHTSGTYITAEQTLISRGAVRRLQVFGRFSTADKTVAPASTHTFAGASWTGFNNRAADSAGIAVFRLSPVLEGLTSDTEVTFEAYYKVVLNSRLEAKLDLQRVQRPGGVADGPSCLVVSLRLRFQLSTGKE